MTTKFWPSFKLILMVKVAQKILYTFGKRTDEEILTEMETISIYYLKISSIIRSLLPRYSFTPVIEKQILSGVVRALDLEFARCLMYHSEIAIGADLDYSKLNKGNSATTQDYFIDDWSNLINTEELADKLDSYENVREGIKMRPSPANEGMTPRSDSRNSTNHEFAPRMNSQYNIEKCAGNFPTNQIHFINSYQRDHRNPNLNSNRKFKCYNCLEFGYLLARNCPKPKIIPVCEKCKAEGHTKKHCEVNMWYSDAIPFPQLENEDRNKRTEPQTVYCIK
ncbi:hypothetical protein TNCV_3220221 [Trichonephila clavipes]|nr:hypothetical protein TNCV_3220221 [Trichonephila clavipes]